MSECPVCEGKMKTVIDEIQEEHDEE